MGIYRGTGGTGDSTTDTTVTTVTEKAAEAASSATSAANSATSAANSASSASTSATNAATSESNAATSASNASTSETNAATSASQAATSATNSASSATASASSASSASTSATNAATSATAAQTAETNAETAETNAETAYANTLAIFGDATDVQNAVDDAEKLAINPEDSQYTLSDAVTTGYSALHYAAKAEDYKTAAEVSKNAAETAETAAETAQGLAETAKTAAETAQSAAETAQAAAELAQSNAETVYDNFDDRYLGNKSGDPLVDNDNEGLTTGTLYFNTTENEMRVYTGTAWEPVQELSGDQTVNSLTSNNNVVVKGNLEVQGTTITVDSATAQTIDLGDNDKIRLGDSDDLQIYHDGTDSYIANTTGTLKLSGNTDITGNITVSGTVDGRDVATDGSKLDGIEASADVTDTANVTAAGALMDSEVTNLAQVKAFDSADYATAAQGTTADNALPTAGGTLTGDLAFGDNVKAKFGASNDLEIYHDGSHSYVRDQGVGNLILQGSGSIKLQSTAGEDMLIAYANDATELYYDNSKKIETTSSGVDITGTVVADGFLGGTNVLRINSLEGSRGSIQISAPHLLTREITYGNNFYLASDGTYTQDSAVIGGGLLQITAPNSDFGEFLFKSKQDPDSGGAVRDRLKIANTGDISFYEDTGTTSKLTWDASAEELQFKDNVAAEFGDGGDLQIYHNGSASFIDDGGTGDLNIRANNLGLRNISGAYYIYCTSGGAVSLRHNNVQKFATTSTGIDVTGAVTADGLEVGGDVNIIGTDTTPFSILVPASVNGSNISQLSVTSANNVMQLETGALDHLRFATNDNVNGVRKRMEITDNGDISFYDDAGTSQDFYWDASTSRLGLGTTSPSNSLHVAGSNSPARFGDDGTGFTLDIKHDTSKGITTLEQVNSGGDIKLKAGVSSGLLLFETSGSEAMRIDSSKNLLVGTTTSPSDTNTIVASAGIYLGGTGADNLLDDYEEGTWTPTTASDATGAFSSSEGEYTKIGRLVFVSFVVNVSTGFTSNIIGGLPFTVADINSLSSYHQVGTCITQSSNTVTTVAPENSTEIRFFDNQNVNDAHYLNTTQDLYRVTISYQTT